MAGVSQRGAQETDTMRVHTTTGPATPIALADDTNAANLKRIIGLDRNWYLDASLDGLSAVVYPAKGPRSEQQGPSTAVTFTNEEGRWYVAARADMSVQGTRFPKTLVSELNRHAVLLLRELLSKSTVRELPRTSLGVRNEIGKLLDDN